MKEAGAAAGDYHRMQVWAELPSVDSSNSFIAKSERDFTCSCAFAYHKM